MCLQKITAFDADVSAGGGAISQTAVQSFRLACCFQSGVFGSRDLSNVCLNTLVSALNGEVACVFLRITEVTTVKVVSHGRKLKSALTVPDPGPNFLLVPTTA